MHGNLLAGEEVASKPTERRAKSWVSCVQRKFLCFTFSLQTTIPELLILKDSKNSTWSETVSRPSIRAYYPWLSSEVSLKVKGNEKLPRNKARTTEHNGQGSSPKRTRDPSTKGTYPILFQPIGNLEFLRTGDWWAFPILLISEWEILLKLACLFSIIEYWMCLWKTIWVLVSGLPEYKDSYPDLMDRFAFVPQILALEA